MNPLWAEPPPEPGARCATCAWRYRGGRGRAVERCRRHEGARVDPTWAGCPAWEAELDCLTCGACCREAYDVVEIGPRDPFRKLHPERVEVVDGHVQVKRSGSRCRCLGPPEGEYDCVVYDERPKLCRDFTLGSANCVFARRKVGLSR